MNLRPSGYLPLAKAIAGFLQYKSAEGLSPNTISSYEHDLKLWLEHVGDQPINKLTPQVLQNFLVWLRTEYKSRQIAGRSTALAPKTIHNIYITLSAFFTWACREFEIANPIKSVPAPKFEQAPVEPFTKEQVEALLKACMLANARLMFTNSQVAFNRMHTRRQRSGTLSHLAVTYLCLP
jgi:integrase/recombinase XerD